MSDVTPALQARDKLLAELRNPRLRDALIDQLVDDGDPAELRQGLADTIPWCVQAATVYHVSDGITEMLTGAAERLTVRSGIAFEKEDLFTPYGFVWNARGWPMPSLLGHEQGVCTLRGFLWAPAVFRDQPRTPCFSYLSLVEYSDAPGIIIFRHMAMPAFGQVTDPLNVITIGKPANMDAATADEDRLRAALAVDQTLRFMYTFFHFVRQRFLIPSRSGDRADRRRYERQGLEMPDSRVVLLRRVHYVGKEQREDHEEPGVEWSHRWVVSGHWRNQFYPSLGLHRAKWINPYVKGPESAPFIPRERALAVVR